MVERFFTAFGAHAGWFMVFAIPQKAGNCIERYVEIPQRIVGRLGHTSTGLYFTHNRIAFACNIWLFQTSCPFTNRPNQPIKSRRSGGDCFTRTGAYCPP